MPVDNAVNVLSDRQVPTCKYAHKIQYWLVLMSVHYVIPISL